MNGAGGSDPNVGRVSRRTPLRLPQWVRFTSAALGLYEFANAAHLFARGTALVSRGAGTSPFINKGADVQVLFSAYVATLGAMRMSWSSKERHGWREYMMIVFAHAVEGALLWWIARNRVGWKPLTLRSRAVLGAFTTFNFFFFTFSPMYSPVRLVVAHGKEPTRRNKRGEQHSTKIPRKRLQ